MSRQAHLPDGTILEFPDGTPDAVMDKAVKEHLGQASAKPVAKAPPPKSFGESLWDATKGVGGSILEGVGQVADFLSDPNLVGAAAQLTPAGSLVAPLAQKGARALNRSGLTGHAAESVANAIPETKQLAGPVRFAGNMIGGALLPVPEARVADVPKNVLAPAKPAASEVAQAAQRQGVDLIPADARGETIKRLTSAAKASPLSAAPVVKAARASQQQLGDAAARIASSQGTAVTTDAAGQAIRQGAERYSRQTATTLSRLYDKANQLAGDIKIIPQQTMAKLDERIARLQNDPSAPEGAAQELIRFRDNISKGVDVQGLRDARTRLSQGVYDGKLRSSSDTAMWKDILGNLSDDISNGLTQAGKGQAARAFNVADKGWAARAEHIDEVLQPILGKGRSGEDIVGSIESMARGSSGGNARLSRLLANMTPEESGNVRSVIIDRMGKATAGNQTAAGDVFSPSTFLTNWNKMTPQAKASLFNDTQLRSDLNDVALLAEKMKASQALSNFSNTGVALVGNVGAMSALAVNHPVAALLGAGSQYLTGRALASPGVARLLVNAGKLPAERQTAFLLPRLKRLATKASPAAAQDLKQTMQSLVSAANDNVGAAALGQTPEEQQRDQTAP